MTLTKKINSGWLQKTFDMSREAVKSMTPARRNALRENLQLKTTWYPEDVQYELNQWEQSLTELQKDYILLKTYNKSNLSMFFDTETKRRNRLQN